LIDLVSSLTGRFFWMVDPLHVQDIHYQGMKLKDTPAPLGYH
jgi:hypothetical protein